MDDTTRERLIDSNIWLRGLYMVLFVIAYNVAEVILILVALFQFVTVLITGSANEAVLRFGRNLSIYVEEIFEFLTFNSEVRPFPFEPFPNEEPGDTWTEKPASESADVAPVEVEAAESESTPEPAEDNPDTPPKSDS